MKAIKVFCISFSLLFSCSTFAAYAPDVEGEMIKKTITEYMKTNNIPGAAVLLYVDGKPYSYYFGYANLSKKTPVTTKTIFEIGSISKVMTGLLLAEEIDFSKMQLKDPVTKFLPELSQQFDEVTLQDLATHTGGLPFQIPANIKTEAELDKLVPLTPHHEQWLYSNASIGLLGKAIEKRTHKDIDTLYRKQILSPLGMQLIGTTVPKKLQAFYAQGYDSKKNPVNPMLPSSPLTIAAGYVKASAGDMQRFLSAAIGLKGTPEKIFYPMRLTQTAFVKLPNHLQGLGWDIRPVTKDNIDWLMQQNLSLQPLPVQEVIAKPTFNGEMLIDKTGATDGFRAYIGVIPNKKSGIVILTNRYAKDGAIAEVGREILFKLTGFMPADYPE